jgi:ribonuclease P protein component
VPDEAGSRGRFSREQRLTSPEDFQRVFAESCRTSLPGLVVLSQPNGLEGPRLGLAISRKHVRRAVDRNRVRRQIRESFRLHQNQLGSRDFVVLARPGLEKLPSSLLRAELDQHWAVHIQRCAKSSSP